VQEVPGSSPAGDRKFLTSEKEGKQIELELEEEEEEKKEMKNGCIRPFNIFGHEEMGLEQTKKKEKLNKSIIS